MKVVLSTGNSRKVEEIRAVFSGSHIEISSLNDVGIQGEAEEDGRTLNENALKKALFAHEHAPDSWTMADDTGIFIDELNGKPGVDTALWPVLRPTAEQVLYELKDLKSRLATFITVVAIVSPTGESWFCEGSVRGKLLKAPRTQYHPRMPYGAIFVPDGSDKTLAEMTIDEENAHSHRGKAFRQARTLLEKLS